MKKKIIISLLLIIPFISIVLVIIFRAKFLPNNEDIIRELKNIKCYETKVEYIIKNTKGEEREDTIQYYSSEDGVRIEFEDEKVKVYKEDGIHVKDSSDSNEYVIDEGMDILHSLAFMNKILSYPLKSDSIKEEIENIELDNSILEYNLQFINKEWYKLLELKYKFKKNETQISLEMNISQSQVNKIKQKAIADIRRWEEWRKVE